MRETQGILIADISFSPLSSGFLFSMAIAEVGAADLHC